MSSDVTVYIFDPRLGAMVASRWLGKRQAINLVRMTLGRPADQSEAGYECWAPVAATEVCRISEGSGHVNGASPSEIGEYASTFPDNHYWWFIVHDY